MTLWCKESQKKDCRETAIQRTSSSSTFLVLPSLQEPDREKQMGSLLSRRTASSTPKSNFRGNPRKPLKAEAREHWEDQVTTGDIAAKLLKLLTEHMPVEILKKLISAERIALAPERWLSTCSISSCCSKAQAQ